MTLSIIAAIGRNRELGKDNHLLWHIPEDLKRFRRLTTGHVVIMGRKTFESLGKPLSNRINIIITSSSTLKINNGYVCHSLRQAILLAKDLSSRIYHLKSQEFFIIGGGQIYAQALPLADKLYLTMVDAEADADTFFPDYSMFTKKIYEKKGESGEYRYTFVELEKIRIIK